MRILFVSLHPVSSSKIIYPEVEEIESHVCSEAELSKFHEVPESEKLGFEFYHHPFFSALTTQKLDIQAH